MLLSIKEITPSDLRSETRFQILCLIHSVTLMCGILPERHELMDMTFSHPDASYTFQRHSHTGSKLMMH